MKSCRPPPKDRKPVFTETTSKPTPAANSAPPKSDHDYCYTCECTPGCCCAGCVVKENEIQRLKHQLWMRDEKLKVNPQRQGPTLHEKFLKSDKKARIYTGLSSKQLFEDFYSCFEKKVPKIRSWAGCNRLVSTKVKRNFVNSPMRSDESFCPRMSSLWSSWNCAWDAPMSYWLTSARSLPAQSAASSTPGSRCWPPKLDHWYSGPARKKSEVPCLHHWQKSSRISDAQSTAAKFSLRGPTTVNFRRWHGRTTKSTTLWNFLLEYLPMEQLHFCLRHGVAGHPTSTSPRTQAS